MDTSLKARGILILLALVVAGVVLYPPGETINLGLDLRGGSHLVFQVETDEALGTETETDAERFVSFLGEQGITAGYETIDLSGFRIVDLPADQLGEAERHADDYFQGWNLGTRGGDLVVERTPQLITDMRSQAVQQAVETIRNRIDQFGVSEPVIVSTGDRIVLQLPGVDDPERVKDLIGRTAVLEFRLVTDGTTGANSRAELIEFFGGRIPDDVEIYGEDLRDINKEIVGERFWALDHSRVISGRNLRTARPSSGELGEPVVSFSLDAEGATIFGETTGNNVGRFLAILLDDKVVTAPRINSRITSDGIIQGSFTLQEAQDLALVLRSGALPAKLTLLEERSVGPSLGLDSIERGKRAGMIGGGLVILAMLAFYRFSGFNAVVALSLNVVLVFAALSLFGATLTLPGIAGIILTIGMAVDANVLIFERIKEELRADRTVKGAVDSGFQKALSSILDANITTLIAAMFLFTFGTGPIRGFAVTLSVGIMASLFTAVFISRWLFDLYLSRRQRVESLSI